jgi:hypothetical protein
MLPEEYGFSVDVFIMAGAAYLAARKTLMLKTRQQNELGTFFKIW